MFEDHDSDEMRESQSLFDSIANSKWFADSHLLLVFTNYAALGAKLRVDPLERFDDTFRGGQDVVLALEHIVGSFKN